VRSWNDPTPTGTTADLHLTWDVPYEPGALKVIGRRGGQIVAQEEIQTAGEPAALALKLDSTSITTNRGLAQIEVRVCDAGGHLVPTADNRLTFTVEGPAKVIAVDNGDQFSHDSYQSNTRPAFNGMAIAYVQAGRTGGHVKVVAKSGALREAAVEFDVAPAPAPAALP
jgi:beta-galactosidase